jgi:hypothetical protein
MDSFKIMRFLFLTVVVLLLINCSTTQKNFAGDRGNDFGDIASISFSSGLGLQISTGTISTGIGFHQTVIGFKNSYWFGSLTCASDMHATFLVGDDKQGLHFEKFGICNEEYVNHYLFRNKAYQSTDPFKKNLYGRVKISAALLIGATVEFNFYELFDFIVGFWGYDPLDDDWNTYYEKIIQAEKAKRNIHAQPIKSK